MQLLVQLELRLAVVVMQSMIVDLNSSWLCVSIQHYFDLCHFVIEQVWKIRYQSNMIYDIFVYVSRIFRQENL